MKIEKTEFEIDFTLAVICQKFNKPGLKGMLINNCELDSKLTYRMTWDNPDMVKIINKVMPDGRLGERYISQRLSK
jgi:hypothetical protein